MASAVYGAKIMKDLDLIPEGYKIMIVGSVQEEDCDGMCWQYIYNKDKIVPEFVISTELQMVVFTEDIVEEWKSV